MNVSDIKAMAECLSTEAQRMITNYLLGGVALGLALGTGNYFSTESSMAQFSILLIVCGSAWLGWVTGKKRSLELRLQAEASRCLAEMVAQQQTRNERLGRYRALPPPETNCGLEQTANGLR
jgi:hypothetical protein